MKSSKLEHTMFQSDRYRAKRIALLSLAFVCALLGVFIFGFNFGITSHSQQVSANYVREQPVTDVLLVMSYDERDAGTPLARDGVMNVMSRSNVGVDVVYMDAYNAPIGSSAYEAWVSQVRQKVAQHGSYGAVICADDEALYFIEDYHDSMFGSTPVVFFGVNDVDHAAHAAASGYMTGMIEQCYFGSIMQAATTLHPNATRFLAIVDQTPAGIGNRGQFDLAMESFDDMSVSYVNASYLTRRELASAVAGAGENTIVFLLDANNDSYGNVYSLDSSVDYVTSASNSPVYRASMGGVGNGIAGCGYRDADLEGRKAAETTIAVLNGTRPANIALATEGNLGYVFDNEVLSGYGVSVADVPAGSTVINRQILSFDTIRLIVLPIALLVAAALLFLGARRLLHQATNEGGVVRTTAPTRAERPVPPASLRRKKKKQQVAYKRRKKRAHPGDESRSDEPYEDLPLDGDASTDAQAPISPALDAVERDDAAPADVSFSSTLVDDDVSASSEAGIAEDAVWVENATADDAARDDGGDAIDARGVVGAPESEPANELENEPKSEPDVAAPVSDESGVDAASAEAGDAPAQTVPEAVDDAPASTSAPDAAESAPDVVAASGSEGSGESNHPDDAQTQDESPARRERRAAPRARAERRPRRTTKVVEVEPRSIVGIEVLDLDRLADSRGEAVVQEALGIVRQRLQDVRNPLFVREREHGFVVGFATPVVRGSQELASIESALREPMTVGDDAVSPKARVCVANREADMKPKDMEEGVELVLGRSAELGDAEGVLFYGERTREMLDEASKIETSLENAIEREAFVVFYQPQIDLRGKDVIGYQAIARLKSKEYAPSLFRPVAEMTGLVTKIDRIVAERAIEQLSKWKRRNKRMRPIHVSFSTAHLTQDDEFVDFLLNQLKAYDVPSSLLRVEVSESLLGVDQERAEKALSRLAEAGVTIVLGNFGTGYASIPDAVMGSASILTVNREFVSAFLTEESDSELKHVTMLAHSLEKRVLVVGIDESWQLEACRKLECDIVQGTSFSPPLLPENAVQFKPLS